VNQWQAFDMCGVQCFGHGVIVRVHMY
jgi:hypothetical protein